MNITRRAALGGATVLAFVPSARARRAPTIHSKIEAHRTALAIAGKAWGVCGEIEKTLPKIGCRVQIGKMLYGARNEDGTDNFNPIYAHTPEAIDRHIAERTKDLLHFHGQHPKNAQAIRERMSERSLRLHAELEALRQEEQRVDDEAGYTQALEDAEGLAEIADDCLLAIHRHAFADMEELRTAATYMVECVRTGQASCDKEMLAEFVEAIAGKVVAS
jgi:hypothetical protein